MTYDHIIRADNPLDGNRFHLSCGFYETTSFFFERLNFAVSIHCKGEFTFYTPSDEKMSTIRLKPMETGRGCYMDVIITETEHSVLFQLPEYKWVDHYPNCDGESDRWDTEIVGFSDALTYPAI